MVWQTDVFGMAVVKCASVDVDYIFVLVILIDIIRNVNRVSLFRRENVSDKPMTPDDGS